MENLINSYLNKKDIDFDKYLNNSGESIFFFEVDREKSSTLIYSIPTKH